MEISNDKFIDDLVLYENYLIYIFMKINKNIKKLGKTREKLYQFKRYCICYKTYLASLEQSLNAVSVVRGPF